MLARELEPDLVLLDVMMPKLDGISVLKELKTDTTLPFVPVMPVTAKADTRDIVDGGRRRRLIPSPENECVASAPDGQRGTVVVKVAATNKCLARSNKSRTGEKATKQRMLGEERR